MRRRDCLKGMAASPAAWPIAVYAQQSKMPIVGVLWHAGNREEEGGRLEVLEQGLADLGYIRGQSITLVHTFAAEDYDRFTNNAVELAKLPADILVAVTQPALMGALRATKIIPIVFLFVSNPVESNLVASLARPGGNITGLSNKQIAKLAREHRLATMGLAEEMAQDGLTMSYGLNPFTAVRGAATYVDKILKGTKPGDLPVEQPTKVDFVINLKSAKEIGLNVPNTLLVLADRVIE
jgi:ABC-type uncharacterized transport system substrate-binding protein